MMEMSFKNIENRSTIELYILKNIYIVLFCDYMYYFTN